jgi:hypothetical protein
MPGMSVVTVRRAAGAAAADRGRGRRARFPLGLRAVVFQVADGRITAVTE